jgi:hypothetical protein
MIDLLLSSVLFRLLQAAYMILTTVYFEVAGAHVYDGE